MNIHICVNAINEYSYLCKYIRVIHNFLVRNIIKIISDPN